MFSVNMRWHILVCAITAVSQSQPLDVSEDDLHQWQMYKITYEKDYESAAVEKERQQIFMDNLKFIREHNAKYQRRELTFEVEINKFADMTSKEFVDIMNGYRRPAGRPRNGDIFEEPKDVELPPSIDWRKKGAVTPVKDQGQCGSCWAFSATGSLEGQNFIKTKKLVSLSEQNLVDCSQAEGNEGCNGGLMDDAFQYVKDNRGIDTEASYPYEAQDDSCRYQPKSKGATDTGFVDITSGSENALQVAVATKGPISVAIDASSPSFQLYKSGVYKDSDCSPEDLDHGVLAIGYGTAKTGGDFWLVKNSWGTDWGMKGYILMARNYSNMCGIASMASFPKV